MSPQAVPIRPRLSPKSDSHGKFCTFLLRVPSMDTPSFPGGMLYATHVLSWFEQHRFHAASLPKSSRN